MLPERKLYITPFQEVLDVAEAMLTGELEYRKGNYEKAFENLRLAVERDDNLTYAEPWGWMQPARHALGALLLQQKNVTEAEKVYRADLKRYPNNCWGLQGLEECLRKQGKKEEADQILSNLKIAKQRSDIPITSSCYCRLKIPSTDDIE